MAEWIAFFVSLFETCVQWLGSMEILGAPVLGILAAIFLLGVLLRALIYKP